MTGSIVTTSSSPSCSGTKRKFHQLSSTLSKDRTAVIQMQKLLLLLNHASKCPYGESHEPCPVHHHCQSMKKLRDHICECPHNKSSSVEKSCDFQFCNRARYTIWHFKNCADPQSCQVCGPVRTVLGKEVAAMEDVKEKQQARMVDPREVDKKLRETEENPTDKSDTIQPKAWNDATKEKCLKLLMSLLDHQHGWVFASPVDPVLLKIPDYFDVIKHPMDLGTIKERLETGAYTSAEDFRADVLLTFNNALQYNLDGSEVHLMAVEMKRHFLSYLDTSELNT